MNRVSPTLHAYPPSHSYPLMSSPTYSLIHSTGTFGTGTPLFSEFLLAPDVDDEQIKMGWENKRGKSGRVLICVDYY